MRGKVGTWVNSQWKYQATPGQFSVAINTVSSYFELMARYPSQNFSGTRTQAHDRARGEVARA
jgi:hypothetical protein